MINVLLFLLCCLAHQKKSIIIGVVDRKENNICEIQLHDENGENSIYVDADLCKSLREGDVVKVMRKDKGRF